MFRRLNDFESGRLILLNFLNGIEEEHFRQSDLRLKLFLREWRARAGALGKPFADLTLLEILTSMFYAYENILGEFPLSCIEFNKPHKKFGRLCRVIAAESLILDDRYSLINREILLKYPSFFDHDWVDDPDNHRIVEILNGRSDAIRRITGADGGESPIQVRGRYPVAWATGERALQDRIAGADPEVARVDHARNALGLPFGTGVHLYRLSYPNSGGDDRHGIRPTFAEAHDNPYFRSRRDSDGDKLGRTADLDKAARDAASIEGVPEMLLFSEPMSEQFEWEYLGRVNNPPPGVNFSRFELRLFEQNITGGVRTADEACQTAIELLNELAA